MRFFGGFFAKAVLVTIVLCACVTLRIHGNEQDAVDPYGGSDEYGGGDGYGGADEDKDSYAGESGDDNGDNKAPKPKIFTTVDGLKQILESDDSSPLVVGYFDLVTHKAEKEMFEQLAAADADYRFALSTEKSVLEESKLDGCAIMVYKPAKYVNGKYEKVKARYPSKSVKKESLQKFYRAKSLPLVAEKNYLSTPRYAYVTVPLVTVYTDVDFKRNPKGYQYLANRISKIANEYVNKAIFVISDKSEFKHELIHYGLPDLSGKRDAGMGLKMGDMHYKSDSLVFSADSLSALVRDYFAGSLAGKVREPSKSNARKEKVASADEDDSTSSVVNLSDANFESLVRESTADILLEFYAPWCGHCMSLKPEYRATAEYFKSDPNIIIAAMDATAHTVPKDFSVQGYPTIIFIPGNDKKNVQAYSGARTEKGMVAYLKEVRTTEA